MDNFKLEQIPIDFYHFLSVCENFIYKRIFFSFSKFLAKNISEKFVRKIDLIFVPYRSLESTRKMNLVQRNSSRLGFTAKEGMKYAFKLREIIHNKISEAFKTPPLCHRYESRYPVVHLCMSSTPNSASKLFYYI